MRHGLIGRLRHDDSGSVLVTATLSTVLMLVLGLALLAIVDTQANESAGERTRDRGFNLAESVLNGEAFVLGRNWPEAAGAAALPAVPAVSPAPAVNICGATGAGFGDTLRAITAPSIPTERLRANLNASYTDAAYDGATWQVNLCDDDGAGGTIWRDALLSNASYDANDNSRLWVRAQATVEGKTRVVVGLVQAREPAAVNAKYGLVTGNLNDDLSFSTRTITNAAVLSGVTAGLVNTYPPVAADLPAYPAPLSGVTGVRCGLLEQLNALKTCITGALGGLSAIPAFDTLVTGGRYEQFPNADSATADAIGQLRSQAQLHGEYIATASGSALDITPPVVDPPACPITAASDPDKVIFIERVGTGNQYCTLDVSVSRTYKALVIGSGRVVIRGNGSITPYSTAGTNLFTGVVYALNLQTADHTVATPTRQLVVIDEGARVRGAVHADGKNATVGIVAPDFSTDALIDGLFCPGELCLLTGVIKLLSVNDLIDALVNGGVCLVSAPLLGCTVYLPATPASSVVGGITSQLTTYGSAIHSDVAVVNRLKVRGASGVTSGTFLDLQAVPAT